MQTSTTTIQVFIVSDHQILLWGLEQLIGQVPAFRIAGTAAGAEGALKEVGLAGADVVLFDMDIGGAPVQDVIPQLLSASQARLLAFTRLNDLDKQDQAVLAGARGIVRQDIAPDMLLKALVKVHEGQMWLDREATSRVLGQFSRQADNSAASPAARQMASLTGRERKIVAVIAENGGETGKSIARKLNISESTLRNHLTSIYDKLGVSNRHGLLAYALRNGLAKPAA